MQINRRISFIMFPFPLHFLNYRFLFVLQRVNQLVMRMMQNLEPTDSPVGALNNESLATFESLSFRRLMHS
jgi:hypothetical protein